MQINLWKPLLLIAALLVLLGVLVAKTYQPQDFAEAELQTARIETDLVHQAEVYRLEEEALAHVNANAAVRRQYWTLAAGGFALALLFSFAFTGGAYSAYAVSTALRFGLVQLAEGRRKYQEIMTRPQLDHLPDGRSVFTTRGGRVLLFDQTNQVKLLEVENLTANPLLVDWHLVDQKAHVAIEQSKHAPRGKVEVMK